MTGRLVDNHLGSYDCKPNTIEGSHFSTTENKIYINIYKIYIFKFNVLFLLF